MTEPSAGELRSSFQSPAPPPHPKRAAPLRNVMQSPDPGSGLQPVQPSGKSVEVRKVEEPKALRPISQGKRNNPSWRFSNESPLHIACYEGNVQKVNTILSQTPQDVSLQASDGDLPIHRAASSPKEGALEVVRALLENKPDLIRARGYDGELPLHVACARSRSFLLVSMLMTQYPDAVHQENARRDLPLHRACMNRGPEQDLILKAVLDAKPEAAASPGSQGHLPLHRACLCSSITNVKYLIQSHPDALRSADNKGQVPHTASVNLTHPIPEPVVARAVDVLCPCK